MNERPGLEAVHARLAAHPLIRVLAPRDLQTLSTLVEVFSFRPGRKILVEGEALNHIFLLSAGSVRAFHRGNEDGEREAIARLVGAPAIFGEVECLRHMPSMETVVTLTDCEFIQIPVKVFEMLLDREPRLCRALVYDLAARFCATTETGRALAFEPAETRLAKLMLEHARLLGTPDGDTNGIVVDVKLTQESLARSLAVSRRTINQIFRRWLDDGVIGRRRGRYIVRERARLEQLARAADVAPMRAPAPRTDSRVH